MSSSSMAWFEVTSHVRLFLFFTEQPRNPWKMLTKPLGSAELQLKITGLMYALSPLTVRKSYLP